MSNYIKSEWMQYMQKSDPHFYEMAKADLDDQDTRYQGQLDIVHSGRKEAQAELDREQDRRQVLIDELDRKAKQMETIRSIVETLRVVL